MLQLQLQLQLQLHVTVTCYSYSYSYMLRLHVTVSNSRTQNSQLNIFLISNFRRVLNVVCFLLGDSPASEFYMPTFRNTLFHLHGRVGACRMNSAGDMFGVLYGKRFGSEMA